MGTKLNHCSHAARHSLPPDLRSTLLRAARGTENPGEDLKAITGRCEAKAQVFLSFLSLTHVHSDAPPPESRKDVSLSLQKNNRVLH